MERQEHNPELLHAPVSKTCSFSATSISRHCRYSSVLSDICNSKRVFLRNLPWNRLEICQEANEHVAKEPLSLIFSGEALGGICHCSLRCSHNIECIIHLWLFGIVWWGSNASRCSFRSYRCLYHTENPMNNVEDKSLFVSVTWPPLSRAC